MTDHTPTIREDWWNRIGRGLEVDLDPTAGTKLRLELRNEPLDPEPFVYLEFFEEKSPSDRYTTMWMADPMDAVIQALTMMRSRLGEPSATTPTPAA